jgi:hypothetical protein
VAVDQALRGAGVELAQQRDPPPDVEGEDQPHDTRGVRERIGDEVRRLVVARQRGRRGVTAERRHRRPYVRPRIVVGERNALRRPRRAGGQQDERGLGADVAGRDAVVPGLGPRVVRGDARKGDHGNVEEVASRVARIEDGGRDAECRDHTGDLLGRSRRVHRDDGGLA